MYAVKEKEKGIGKKRKMDSDDDEVIEKLEILDNKLTKVLEVNPHLNLPLGLSSVLYDTFKCSICLRSPIRPPCVFGRCCKRIIGCQECVDRWYSDGGFQKNCPLCQGERGYADSMLILGLDEFLTIIRVFSRVPEASLHVPPPPPEVDIDTLTEVDY